MSAVGTSAPRYRTWIPRSRSAVSTSVRPSVWRSPADAREERWWGRPRDHRELVPDAGQRHLDRARHLVLPAQHGHPAAPPLADLGQEAGAQPVPAASAQFRGCARASSISRPSSAVGSVGSPGTSSHARVSPLRRGGPAGPAAGRGSRANGRRSHLLATESPGPPEVRSHGDAALLGPSLERRVADAEQRGRPRRGAEGPIGWGRSWERSCRFGRLHPGIARWRLLSVTARKSVDSAEAAEQPPGPHATLRRHRPRTPPALPLPPSRRRLRLGGRGW